ncbi:hypothetical protein F1880_006361 [Penicillium rolfsii]|nr:hypothetical protein F1880_006361 [Penicillium rolfsii]
MNCDEARPSCSRCSKHEYSCQYQGSTSGFLSSEEQDLSPTLVAALEIPLHYGAALSSSEGPITPGGDLFSSSGSLLCPSSHPSPFPISPQSNLCDDGQASCSQASCFLDMTELELLSHNLTHTSKTIPFDALDLYALSVGIPNLAFKNRPVMSSLIALAAACKSHDLVKQSKTPLESPVLSEVQKLLELAECHHRASLQHIQATVSHSDWYDAILANAALMVLYASASHSLRVHLAVAAKQRGQRLPAELRPQHSQWISFTRAAHTASTAILNEATDANKAMSVMMALAPYPSHISSDAHVLSPQSGPSEDTERLFLPLVASTYQRALGRLSERADMISAHLAGIASFNSDLRDLDVCLNTLPTLEKCASDAFSRRETGESPESPRHEAPSFDGFSKVSPWVGNYMISVTSMRMPIALRRTIMSFLNEAPSDYLGIIQSILDLPIPEASPTENETIWDSPYDNIPLLNATQLLAMDIFAHWLVLVMLLDGVWWIGGIGQWELGQVVSLMKTQEFFHQVRDDTETWWPQSMYMVKLELGSTV